MRMIVFPTNFTNTGVGLQGTATNPSANNLTNLLQFYNLLSRPEIQTRSFWSSLLNAGEDAVMDVVQALPRRESDDQGKHPFEHTVPENVRARAETNNTIPAQLLALASLASPSFDGLD